MPTLEGTTQRFALNQSSTIGLKEYNTVEGLFLPRGGTVALQCALFKGEPIGKNFIDVLTNVVRVDLTVRKTYSLGTVLMTKTVLNASFHVGVTFADWDGGLDAQFTFELSALQTNQTVLSNGHLPIYWEVLATTTTHSFSCGFGYGEIIAVGINASGTIIPDLLGSFILRGLTGFVGGGTTNVDGAVTTESIAKGSLFNAVIGDVFYTWELRDGTAVSNPPMVIRPVDYNGLTNAKNLIQVGG